MPRKGEEPVGMRFFESFDYKVEQCPHPWEGEADLKWLRKNIYVGGLGSRSTSEAYEWMRQRFGMEIIEIHVADPKLYHFDCMFFPLTETKALVNVSAFNWVDLFHLEKYVDVVEVPPEYRYEGWTNSVRLGNSVLYAPYQKPWQPFAELLDRHGFSLEIFDLSEFDKSGADLSCLCFHMNHRNRY
jgi:N-dimethylarginine dimethylaminohydrolase